jgi:uncharacterized protein involved in type VI secretion and phage assembly
MASFFGKYRGTVINNQDPEQRARVQIKVPDVPGAEPSAWALPCVPFAGHQAGFYFVPAVGDEVWVEFEHGDPRSPICVGGLWSSAGDLPPETAADPQSQKVIVKTTHGLKIAISDAAGNAGGITLSIPGGASLSLIGKTITLDNGAGARIVLQGSTVSSSNPPIDGRHPLIP